MGVWNRARLMQMFSQQSRSLASSAFFWHWYIVGKEGVVENSRTAGWEAVLGGKNVESALTVAIAHKPSLKRVYMDKKYLQNRENFVRKSPCPFNSEIYIVSLFHEFQPQTFTCCFWTMTAKKKIFSTKKWNVIFSRYLLLRKMLKIVKNFTSFSLY